MSTFETEIVKQGRQRTIRVDVSLDDFATVHARWGDRAGFLDNVNQYSRRIVGMGPIRRALGQNRIAASSTTDLTMDNVDGALDWLCGRENISTFAKARFRIFVCISDEVTLSPFFFSKQVGEYVMHESPVQTNSSVIIKLADDMMVRLSMSAALPTLEDWRNACDDAYGADMELNPFTGGMGIARDLVSDSTPIQLAFGEDWIRCMPHILLKNTHANYSYSYPLLSGSPTGPKVIVPVCCTTSTGIGSPGEIFEGFSAGTLAGFGSGNTVSDNVFKDSFPPKSRADGSEQWRVERSPVITKNGRSFRVIYLVVDPVGPDSRGPSNGTGFYDRLAAENANYTAIWVKAAETSYQTASTPPYNGDFSQQFLGGYTQSFIEEQGREYKVSLSRVVGYWVKGAPLSCRVNAPTPASPKANAVNIVNDLVTHYANSPATIDSINFARALSQAAGARASGVVEPWIKSRNERGAATNFSIRQTITAICQSSDIDVFLTWTGKVGIAVEPWDYESSISVSSATKIPETQTKSMQRRLPNEGERGAAFNRLYLDGSKQNPLTDVWPPEGPFEFEGAIQLSERIIEATLNQSWRPIEQQQLLPQDYRNLEITGRDRVSFETNITALRFELGDVVKLTWTRGLAGPYAETLIQIDSLDYAPQGDAVAIQGLWRGDLITDRAYLLDDENLIVRTKVGSGDCVVTSGDALVSFGGTIDLIAMGVSVGDILELKDSSLADGVFTRFRHLYIGDVGSSTSVELVDSDLSFGGSPSASIPNTEWSIRRGATTSHTAISDPTNYPNGSDMYGKATKLNGEYFNGGGFGNKLLAG